MRSIKTYVTKFIDIGICAKLIPDNDKSSLMIEEEEEGWERTNMLAKRDLFRPCMKLKENIYGDAKTGIVDY
jgi:hypothetical protein